MEYLVKCNDEILINYDGLDYICHPNNKVISCKLYDGILIISLKHLPVHIFTRKYTFHHDESKEETMTDGNQLVICYSTDCSYDAQSNIWTHEDEGRGLNRWALRQINNEKLGYHEFGLNIKDADVVE